MDGTQGNGHLFFRNADAKISQTRESRHVPKWVQQWVQQWVHQHHFSTALLFCFFFLLTPKTRAPGSSSRKDSPVSQWCGVSVAIFSSFFFYFVKFISTIRVHWPFIRNCTKQKQQTVR